MKVLNLRCANGHGFEGWFASEDDFLDAYQPERTMTTPDVSLRPATRST